MKAKVSTTKPLLVLLYGFPGSGKTHFANNIARQLQCAHVHDDRIRHELFENPRYDDEENDVVAQLMNYMTEEFLAAGLNIVYDADASRAKTRKHIANVAKKHGVRTLVVWFQMDAESAYARLGKRDRRTADDKYARPYTEEAFRHYISRMQQPKNEDYVVVSGKHVFPSQSAAFFKKLVESGLIEQKISDSKVPKPGLVNLIPRSEGRVDLGRRNISIN